MKTINPNVWPFIWRTLLLIAAAAFLFMALPGCSPGKRLEKAKQKVLTDAAAFDEVGRKWNELNPCINDSTTSFAEGGYDSVSLRGYFDWLNGIRPEGESSDDSIVIVNPVDTGTVSWPCADQLTIYYKRGYKNGRNSILDKKIPIPRPDTLKTTVKDKQYMKVLEEALAREKEEKIRLQGVTQTQEKEIQKKDKKITGWIWLFIGAVALLILIVILALIGKIKRIFP